MGYAKHRLNQCVPETSSDHISKAVGSTSLPASVPNVPKLNFEQPWNKFNGKCGLYPQIPSPALPKHGTVFIFFQGPVVIRQISNMHLGHSTSRWRPMTWWMGLIYQTTLSGTRSSSSSKLVSTLRFSHRLHATASAASGVQIPPDHNGSGR